MIDLHSDTVTRPTKAMRRAKLYVSQDARHQGVGRALLDAVGERSRARGVSYIEVQADDKAAVFYKASGYEPESGVRVISRSYAL